MNYIKKIAIMILAITMTSSAMAATWDTTSTNASLEVKSAPRLIAKTSNSVTLEWDKVDAATSYIVKFSTKSVANSTEKDPYYDNESDPVTSTWTVVTTLSDGKPLASATEYYFSVVALDKDNNESDTYSDELKVKTDEATVAPSNTVAPAWAAPLTTVAPASASGTTTTVFALKSANAIDNKTIELEFSAPLNPKPFSVKITKTTDGSDVPTTSVTNDTVNPIKAIVKISTMLDPKSTYSITIIDASDANWNNIQQWVDWIREFTTVENLAQSPEATLNAGGPDAMMSGTTASWTLTPNMEVAKTGPRENLIVLLALVLSFGMVYSYRKRFAK